MARSCDAMEAQGGAVGPNRRASGVMDAGGCWISEFCSSACLVGWYQV